MPWQAVLKALTSSASFPRNQIPAQKDILRAGGTDAGVIHTTRMGVYTGGISVPTRYIHSACEVIDLRDLDAGLKLLLNYLG